MFPLQIDGRLYDNVNHFYQLAKTEALCGVTSLLMTDSDEAGSNSAGGGGTTKEKTKDYNTLARNILKINKVDKSAAEEWRKTAGLEAMQRALLAKVEQCDELRKALLDSGDKLLVHCFGGDDFYASACNGRYIQDWARSMSNNKVVIKIPLDFPLTSETVLSVPKFGLGRNALGVIYMQLREMLRDGLLPYKGVLKEVSEVFGSDLGACEVILWGKPFLGGEIAEFLGECDEQNNHSMDILNQQDEEGGGPSVVPSVPAPIKGESRDSDMGDGFAMDGSPI
ncbi:unnamed protein product [Anisakis simplex]|uniref:DUF1768 domain-containing protein n=1 Tax=Anisakis simplex TaxID=6269 RepID=A0A0M3KEL1_ANISI|nr:unnamed protein product [Anisakis simplex]